MPTTETAITVCPSSVATYTAHVHAFYAWALDVELIATDPGREREAGGEQCGHDGEGSAVRGRAALHGSAGTAVLILCARGERRAADS
jgi:hypothetical protein